MEYFENTEDSIIKLYWSSSSQPKQIIPQSQLFCDVADLKAPTVPTGLVAAPISETGIDLDWTPSTDNSGSIGYKIFRNGIQIGTVVNSTNYSDTGLTAATGYLYSVSAYDTAGNNSNQCPFVYAITP